MPPPALAHTDLSICLNLGGSYAAPPRIVYQPAPTCVEPAPAPSYDYGPPSFYGPAPGYRHHPNWREREWHDRHWRR